MGENKVQAKGMSIKTSAPGGGLGGGNIRGNMERRELVVPKLDLGGLAESTNEGDIVDKCLWGTDHVP